MQALYKDEDGKVVHAKVLNGIGGGCDEMAVDAVKKQNLIRELKIAVNL
ncbi:MAG: hypothetical protein MZV64_50605 [Ignavibacteriales bacterium]|nr:hypothetical protein [Ignavibacteriales bacterium]